MKGRSKFKNCGKVIEGISSIDITSTYELLFGGIKLKQKMSEKFPADWLKNVPVLTPPFIKEKSKKKYTLILDLDETLVHYFEKDGQGQFGIRPHLNEFL